MMFKVLKNGKKPTKGSKHSACVDLYASEDVVIGAGESKLIGLGVAIDLDFNYIKRNFNHLATKRQDEYKEWFNSSHYLQLMLRSSLAKELLIANGVGVIDLDYKDEIKIRLHNPLGSLEFYQDYTDQSKKPVEIKKGQKIAQITLLEHKSYLFGIDSDVERDGGFGSTGE